MSKGFEPMVVNGSCATSAIDLMDAYLSSKKQLDELPKKLIHDRDEVGVKLFKEIGQQQRKNALFRKTDTVNTALVNYWLANVKKLANAILSVNKVPAFESLSKSQLKEIASLSSDPENILKLPELLASMGVVLVFEPSLDGLKTDGVVFKLESGNPVIGLSLRYKRLDMFWFNLMHELAHICLHYDKLDGYILDDFDSKRTDQVEIEADRLAGSSLIPRNIWRTCPARKKFTLPEVEEFGKKHNIHPIVIAGRLQKELNAHGTLASYVNSVDVRELVFDE